MTDLHQWLEEIAEPGFSWYVKRLSGNDTLANGSHQAGPYIPRKWILESFPSLNRPDEENPRMPVDFFIDSHGIECQPQIIWYNNKLHGGTRNEVRVTGLGGRESSLLDPENTGALTFFAFRVPDGNARELCRVWICKSEIEEKQIESLIGLVDPGDRRTFRYNITLGQIIEARDGQVGGSCWLEPRDIPQGWRDQFPSFPSGWEIVQKAMEIKPCHDRSPDNRILKRRKCEAEIFYSLEKAAAPPQIWGGFSSVEDFLEIAQKMIQRRKARAGRSLELHTRKIFLEEGLKEGTDFEYQPVTELGKRPDFLFPSAECYRNSEFPASRLRMLAVKTTCKDRWRQVLDEANRIENKHLLTLQEGMSENQFEQMKSAGIQIVIPAPSISTYSQRIQPHLKTISEFITEILDP